MVDVTANVECAFISFIWIYSTYHKFVKYYTVFDRPSLTKMKNLICFPLSHSASLFLCVFFSFSLSFALLFIGSVQFNSIRFSFGLVECASVSARDFESTYEFMIFTLIAPDKWLINFIGLPSDFQRINNWMNGSHCFSSWFFFFFSIALCLSSRSHQDSVW